MSRADVNRLSFVAPLAFSAAAFAIVIGNIIAGVRPQPDETASAHLWQLLMAGQLPIVAAFLVTSDWRTRWPILLLGLQLAAFLAACLPVWIAGY